MNIDFFLERCEELWPGKPLTLSQRSIYGAKLLQFEGRDLAKMYDYLSEHSKFFPKVADVFDAARQCAVMDRIAPSKPHEWTANDCMFCGGSGQLAVFYEQLIDPNTGDREKRLKRVMQYESSQGTMRQNDWIRYYFRCSCPRGDVSTLNKGLPVWSNEKPSVIREVR